MNMKSNGMWKSRIEEEEVKQEGDSGKGERGGVKWEKEEEVSSAPIIATDTEYNRLIITSMAVMSVQL